MSSDVQKISRAAYMRKWRAANAEKARGYLRARRALETPAERSARLEFRRASEAARVAAKKSNGWKRELSPAQRAAAIARSKEFHRVKRQGSPEEKARLKALHVGSKYGLTIDEYTTLIGSDCEICGASATQAKIECDHDHTTGAVRGPLCGSCNRTLGAARDNPKRLLAAVDYLARHSAGSQPTPKYL